MQKARLVLLLIVLCRLSGSGVFLYAQDREDDYPDSDDDITIETDWDVYRPDLYARGDQTFAISLGVIFPTVFLNNGKKIEHNFDPSVGGTGSLAYSYFLNSHLFLGAEIGIKFNYTLADNTVFLVPLGVRAGWQFIIRRFEIPLNFTIGIAPQRYLNQGYLGMVMKGGASVYYRFNPDWSFGISSEWSWYPQWPKENGRRVPHKDMHANIVSLTISARYHF